MTQAIYAVAAFAVLFLIIAITGALLPKAHKASRSAQFRHGRVEIFDVIAGLPDWRSDIRKYEALPAVEGRRRWRETTSHGAILYELVESSPPNRYVTRIADPTLPYGGTWTFELTGESPATRLTITEAGEIRNVIFRCLARFVFGYTSAMDQYLKMLAKRLREEIRIE